MRHRGVKNLNRIVKTNLKYQTREFFSNSTLHGVRYIAEEGRSFGEKLMWFSFVAIGAVAAFVIIASLWEKFQTNPTITGLDTDFHDPVLIFPTVTVCPMEPFNDTSINETAYRLSNYDSDTQEVNMILLQNITRLSYDNLKEFTEFNLKNYNAIKGSITKWDKETLRKYAFNVAIDVDDVFDLCKFRAEVKDCKEIFQPIYSERGLCFSFNARYHGEFEEKNEELIQIFETDKSWALEMYLKRESLVYLHSMREVFSYDNRAQFNWEPEDTVDLLISMKETYTTEDAHQLSVAQRKCIFPGEQKMNFHEDEEEYSLSSCMKECRMKRATEFCKCIPPFYLPKKSTRFPQCSLQNMTCIFNFAQNITDITKCSKCELSCDNTVYDIEKFSKINPTTSTETTANSERINIEFLTWPIIRYKREVLFGWVDLLVSFGGIAGLFLGFSLLSGIEIIYYFTVRAGCMMYKNRKELYEIQQEEDSRPLIKYDLSLVPKFKRSPPSASPSSSLSLADIQIVRPVEPLVDIINPTRPLENPMITTKERNRNQRREKDDLSNEKINESNRAFHTPRSLLLPLNRQIDVNSDEVNYARDGSEMQGDTEQKRLNRIFRPIQIGPLTREITREIIVPSERYHQRPTQNYLKPEDFDLVYRGYLP